MTISFRPAAPSSMWTFARSLSLPRPVSYACVSSSSRASRPPVGKSGPGMTAISPAVVILGSSIWATTASMASPRLWGGMLVARPTAMPLEPFTSRFGKRAGSRSGSLMVSSKFRWKPTVSFSMSLSITSACSVMRASV